MWNATTDQPYQAIAKGLISRFGSLGPDGGQAQWPSLSRRVPRRLAGGQIGARCLLQAHEMTGSDVRTNAGTAGTMELRTHSRATARGTISQKA
jgi:hypothetical protein